MPTERSKAILLERRGWADNLASLDLLRQSLISHMARLARDANDNTASCNFCDRTLANPEVTSHADGKGGAAICNICVQALAQGDSDNNEYGIPGPAMRLIDEVVGRRRVTRKSIFSLSKHRSTAAVSAARDECIYRLLHDKLAGIEEPINQVDLSDWFSRERSAIYLAEKRHADKLAKA